MFKLDQTPNVRFDEGRHLDEEATPRKGLRMIKVKLDLQVQTDDAIKESAGTIKEKMTTNAVKFPASAAAVVLLNTRIGAFNTAIQNAATGKLTQAGLVDVKNATRADVEDSMRTLGGQVDEVAKGDIGIIHDAGMNGSSAGGPLTMEQVTELSITSGQHEGEVDWICHRQPGAIFNTETRPDVTPRVWTHRSASKASSGTIPGLPSMTKVCLRVNAQGSNNTGGWSDIAIGNVP